MNNNNVPLTDNARAVFMRRYAMKNDAGEPIETPEETMRRVAHAVARKGMKARTVIDNQEVIAGDVWKLENRFYEMLCSLDFLPNSPTFTGADTGLGQLAACFVLPIEDDMGSHPDGIFSTLRNAALIQQTGGGNGFSFSRLRPKGALVNTSKGKATGPVGFLRVYDSAFGEIAQGGTRRGANMAVLRVDHPDVIDFITAKQTEGSIRNFNISVALTNEFMQAVKEDGVFELKYPGHPDCDKVVRARDLFEFICALAWHNGEPGALFIDTANLNNPVPNLYELEATNPCGEQWLGPYENCCLGSINLANHVVQVDNGSWIINWGKLKETTRLATEFLDCVVDANQYVEAVPQLREAALRARRIGLGIMGFADVCYHLGVRYGSGEAQKLADCIMEFIRYHSMCRSVELAEKFGPFPEWKNSIYRDGLPVGFPMSEHVDHGQRWGRPNLDWHPIDKAIKMTGIRNAAQTTIAPTGTISTVAGVEGYGCEPVFALGYTRHVKEAEGDVDLEYVSSIFSDMVYHLYSQGELTTLEKDQLYREAIERGTIQNLDPGEFKNPDIVSQLQHVFVTAADITPEEQVAMQAAFQRWVDNSLSKTINMPSSATIKDVRTAYMQAWETGCKGITVYVEGSRQEVVLETKAEQERKRGTWTAEPVFRHKTGVTHPSKLPRPDVLAGVTYRKNTPSGTAYVTINEASHGPFEVFVTVGKAGSEVSAISEGMGRLISLILRMPSSVHPEDRLAWIAEELDEIGGSNSIGFGKKRVKSLPDGIAKALIHYMTDNWMDDEAWQGVVNPEYTTETVQSHSTGDICPECGNASLSYIEGCQTCHDCSYSRCG